MPPTSLNKLDVARKLQHVVDLLDRSPADDGRSQDAAVYLRVAIAFLLSDEEVHTDGGERLPSAPLIAQHDLAALALDPALQVTGSVQGFDPVKMSLDLIRLVNGPGGKVEQTYGKFLYDSSHANTYIACQHHQDGHRLRQSKHL